MISFGGSHKQICQISNCGSRTTAIEINGNANRQLSPGILDLLAGNICIVMGCGCACRKKEPAIPVNSLGKQKKSTQSMAERAWQCRFWAWQCISVSLQVIHGPRWTCTYTERQMLFSYWETSLD